jgi:hypothetical protein
VTLAPAPGGGLRVVEVDPNFRYATFIQKGDIFRAMDGKPLAALEDLPVRFRDA